MNIRKSKKTYKLGILTITIALSITAFSALAYAAGSSFFQGFETDASGWDGATRVASGVNGIISASGSWHAEVASGAFTRWGGYGGIPGVQEIRVLRRFRRMAISLRSIFISMLRALHEPTTRALTLVRRLTSRMEAFAVISYLTLDFTVTRTRQAPVHAL